MCPTQRDVSAGQVDRATAVLESFDHESPQLTYAEIARRTGLPRSTVHRLVQDLVHHGWLEKHDGRLQLGMRMFELGLLVPRQRSLREAAVPFMEDLRQATGFRIQLAVLDKIEIVHVAILLPKNSPPMHARIGGRLPTHATGEGKAILAYSRAEVAAARVEAGLDRLTPYTIRLPGQLFRELTTIRSQGVAYEREEARLGVSCAAAPVFGEGGVVVGALAASGPTARLDLQRVGPAVRTAALALSRTISNTPELKPRMTRRRRPPPRT